MLQVLQTRELLLEATLELHQLQPNFDVNLDDAVLDTFKRNLTAIAQGFSVLVYDSNLSMCIHCS